VATGSRHCKGKRAKAGRGWEHDSFMENKSWRQVSADSRNSETKQNPLNETGQCNLTGKKHCLEQPAVLPDKPAGWCCSVFLAERQEELATYQTHFLSTL